MEHKYHVSPGLWLLPPPDQLSSLFTHLPFAWCHVDQYYKPPWRQGLPLGPQQVLQHRAYMNERFYSRWFKKPWSTETTQPCSLVKLKGGQTSSLFLTWGFSEKRSLCSKFPFHVRTFEWIGQTSTGVWYPRVMGQWLAGHLPCDFHSGGTHPRTASSPRRETAECLRSLARLTVNEPHMVEQPGSGLDFLLLGIPACLLSKNTKEG